MNGQPKNNADELAARPENSIARLCTGAPAFALGQQSETTEAMMALTDQQANEIAAAVDLIAGGYFKKCLAKAAQLGAEAQAMTTTKAADELPKTPSAKVSDEAVEAAQNVLIKHGGFALSWQVKEALTAALPHLTACVGKGWRAIESAPKDGKPILLWLRKPIERHYPADGICPRIAIGFWEHGRWVSVEVEDCGSMGGEMTGSMDDWCCIDVDPTHWMPFPAAPTPEASRG